MACSYHPRADLAVMRFQTQWGTPIDVRDRSHKGRNENAEVSPISENKGKEEKHDYPHRDSGDSHYAFLRSLIKPTQGCQLECAVSEPAQRTAVADRPRNIQWDALIKLIKQDATRQQATET